MPRLWLDVLFGIFCTHSGPRNSEAIFETSADPLVVRASFFPSVVVRGEDRTAVVDLEGEAGGNLRGVEAVARVEGVAKTVRDGIPRPFGVQIDVGANVQHVIRKIAAGGSRLEPLTDARTAPEREDTVHLPFVAERRFEVISDLSAAYIDSRFKGTAENCAESRSRKSAQDAKWSFCLTAGTLCPANQERA